MTSNPQGRKDDHLRHALTQARQGQEAQGTSSFDQVRFVHHPLLTSGVSGSPDLTTSWAGRTHPLPLYINGMTGGTGRALRLNRELATVARETGLAMASGSVSIALKYPELAPSFEVIRQVNPQGFVLANLGAHHSLENAKRAVDLLDADGLQIHLNRAQEIVMPEGDRDFSMWADRIHEIVHGLGLPVIVKEVGNGMSRETIQTLRDLGVETIDVAGRGGTNFVAIENARRHQLDYQDLFTWGQTTVESLLEALSVPDRGTILASGGLRSFMDLVKALALGAQAGGLAGLILEAVDSGGAQAGIDLVNDWRQALEDLLLLLGCQSIQDLQSLDLVITGSLKEWAQERQLNWQAGRMQK